MARVVVIGSGPMGLAAAYHAAKAGHEVEVLEGAPVPGGMAAHFDFDGLSIERFYHFVCKDDQATFALMDELGIGDKMRWRITSMGNYSGGRLHRLGDPISLLKFPEISLISRLRYGLFAFVCTRKNRWDSIETEQARSWITRWCGKEVYDKLWKPLFELKFHRYANDISAAWIWTRIRRIGRSRHSMFAEELGYMDGGSQTLVDALMASVQKLGGKVNLSSPALEIIAENGKVTGVRTPSGVFPADAVISTVPTPLLQGMAACLPDEWLAKYAAIHNTGVCCPMFKLKRSVTPHFWVNVNEPDMEVPGFIEFSNLRPVDDTVVYVPYYMPTDHPKFSWTDDQLLQESFGYLKRVNPQLSDKDIVSTHVGRLRYAQPVCESGFAAKIPPVQTPIAGLQIADTCFYYPEDRGISESVRLGKEMARESKLEPVPKARRAVAVAVSTRYSQVVSVSCRCGPVRQCTHRMKLPFKPDIAVGSIMLLEFGRSLVQMLRYWQPDPGIVVSYCIFLIPMSAMAIGIIRNRRSGFLWAAWANGLAGFFGVYQDLRFDHGAMWMTHVPSIALTLYCIQRLSGRLGPIPLSRKKDPALVSSTW